MNCDNWEQFYDYQNECLIQNEENNKTDRKILEISLGTGGPLMILIPFGYFMVKYPDFRQFVMSKVRQIGKILMDLVIRNENGVESVELSEIEYKSIGSVRSNHSWPLEDIDNDETVTQHNGGGYVSTGIIDTHQDFVPTEPLVPENIPPSISSGTSDGKFESFESSDSSTMSVTFEDGAWIPPFRNVDVTCSRHTLLWTPPFHARSLSLGSEFTVDMGKTCHDTVDMVCETPKRPKRLARNRLNPKFKDFELY